MKHCEGRCRRKYIKSEGNAYACKYNRSFIVDKKNDNKWHEVCIKPNRLLGFWNFIIRSIWGDVIGLDDISGGRKSSRTERNQSFLKERNEKLL